MVVGVLRIELYLHDVHSLKEKRGVVQKLLARSRNKFPVSCAEVDNQDLWQRATLGFVMVSSSQAVITPVLERLEELIEAAGLAEIIDSQVEFIHL